MIEDAMQEKIWASVEWDTVFEAGKWADRLPMLQFKPEWRVHIVPPRIGSLVRFVVWKGDRWVSVYFDGYNLLGYSSSPYWEAYPIMDQPQRFAIHNTAGLLAAIEQELDRP